MNYCYLEVKMTKTSVEILVILCIAIITHTHSLSLHIDHCHNRVVRRKTEYRVNISMPDNDIEMVEMDKLIPSSNTAVRFSRTHKKPHRKSQTRNLVGKYNNTRMSPKVTRPVQTLSQIDLISGKNYSNSSLTKGIYRNTKSNEKSEDTSHTVEIDIEESELEELANPPRIAREISADRIWNIVQIWLIIYFVLAIPLWSTIGKYPIASVWKCRHINEAKEGFCLRMAQLSRCCCCLVCKCFRAHETIREAKQYAMWNPPGVLRKITGDVIYTPSEMEKEAYEELEHLIRTL